MQMFLKLLFYRLMLDSIFPNYLSSAGMILFLELNSARVTLTCHLKIQFQELWPDQLTMYISCCCTSYYCRIFNAPIFKAVHFDLFNFSPDIKAKFSKVFISSVNDFSDPSIEKLYSIVCK